MELGTQPQLQQARGGGKIQEGRQWRCEGHKTAVTVLEMLRVWGY